MDKPKVDYRDFVKTLPPRYAPYSVSDIIERYIREMNGTATVRGLKPLGGSHLYALRMLQTLPIGAKDARKLTKTDFIDHAKRRREKVSAPTVNQDITYLRGPLSYAPSAWDDCKDVGAKAITKARPVLLKFQLIGKGTPRTRVSTEDEDERLLAHFAVEDEHSKIKMVPVILFAGISTRRRGEICRIELRDIDWDKKDGAGNATPMYMVRDMKHPTKKQGNHKWFPLFPELVEIIIRLPSYHAYMERVQRLGKELVDQDRDRLFPYNSVSVGARYINGKRVLGIVGLRFHDMRRKAITHWLKVFDSPYKVKQISGHENTMILERVYAAPNPADLHASLAALTKAQPAASIPS